MRRTRHAHGICGKLKTDGKRCTNRAGCQVPHPATGDAAGRRPAVMVGMKLVNNAEDFDFIVGNDDYRSMSEGITSYERAFALINKGATNVPKDQQSDSLGYWLQNDASDEMRSLSHVVHAGAKRREIEIACVVGSEMLHAMERDHLDSNPSADLMQVRQTMCCIAAHPNATDAAVRQAVRSEGKYAAREVLKRSSDPEMLEFALDNADVGVWHATSDEGEVNRALPSHLLDEMVQVANRPANSDEEAEYRNKTRASLRTHPNITTEQLASLSSGSSNTVSASRSRSDTLCEVHANDMILRTNTFEYGTRIRGGFSGDRVLFDFSDEDSPQMAADRLVLSAEKAEELAMLLADSDSPAPDALESQETVFEDSNGRTVSIARTPMGLADWYVNIEFDRDDKKQRWGCLLLGHEADQISRLSSALGNTLKNGEAGDYEAGDWDF